MTIRYVVVHIFVLAQTKRLISKDNIVTRLNIRVRYRNRVLSFHLPNQIPMRSKLLIVGNILCVSELSAVFLMK